MSALSANEMHAPATRDRWSTCRPEFEDEQAWEQYVERASQQDLESSICQVMDLESRSARWHRRMAPGTRKRKAAIAANQRWHRLFDIALAAYARRFGQPWCPF